MTAQKFLTAFGDIFERIQSTQMENIHTAATWVAEAMAKERLGVLFGTGHSFIPTMDISPRIGSYPGWLPIHEISTSYIARNTGDMGLRQSLFLEKVEGFGKVVLQNYALTPDDVMIVVSNSGVNTMGVEVAMEAKKMGLKTVGVTSLVHSKAGTSYHSSGKKLFEVVDLVIDNCVPAGDALVDVDGFPAKVGASSTIAGCIILQALASETASLLAQQGIVRPVFPSHNDKLSEEENHKMIDRWYEEDSKLLKKALR